MWMSLLPVIQLFFFFFFARMNFSGVTQPYKDEQFEP